MRDIKIDLQKPATWKFQLTITINVISYKDTNEEQVIYSKSDYKEVMTYVNAKEVINEIFELLLSWY